MVDLEAKIGSLDPQHPELPSTFVLYREGHNLLTIYGLNNSDTIRRHEDVVRHYDLDEKKVLGGGQYDYILGLLDVQRVQNRYGALVEEIAETCKVLINMHLSDLGFVVHDISLLPYAKTFSYYEQTMEKRDKDPLAPEPVSFLTVWKAWKLRGIRPGDETDCARYERVMSRLQDRHEWLFDEDYRRDNAYPIIGYDEAVFSQQHIDVCEGAHSKEAISMETGIPLDEEDTGNLVNVPDPMEKMLRAKQKHASDERLN